MSWFAAGVSVSVFSGLYTSLWGAFKDSPYEGFKPWAFLRSVSHSLLIYLLLYATPSLRRPLQALGLMQLFFLVMGIERFFSEIYKGFFRTEDQTKYQIPSRATFFGRPIHSDLLRYAAGLGILAAAFGLLWLDQRVAHYPAFLLAACCTGLAVACCGAYKDAPFEGFFPLGFWRSPAVLALLSPLFYLMGPVPLGFLLFMNGGLERFLIEYYKTYVQRNASGKFRPDLRRRRRHLDTRGRFYFLARVLIIGLIVVTGLELGLLQ